MLHRPYDPVALWPPHEAATVFGGAGMVEALADVLDEEILLAGAELVWEAGPPAK